MRSVCLLLLVACRSALVHAESTGAKRIIETRFPLEVRVDGDHLEWETMRWVYRAPLSGGTPTILAKHRFVGQFLHDGGQIFFIADLGKPALYRGDGGQGTPVATLGGKLPKRHGR